jgi:hypothetical protein
MGESRTAKVCPYCEGKGYISVVVELPPDDDSRGELSKATWVRSPALCATEKVASPAMTPTEGAS